MRRAMVWIVLQILTLLLKKINEVILPSLELKLLFWPADFGMSQRIIIEAGDMPYTLKYLAISQADDAISRD